MTRPNPLTAPIIECLELHPEGVSEYQLLNWLQQQGLQFVTELADDSDQALFQRHFVIMNALYRLQPYYAERGLRLVVSPLRIHLLPLLTDGGDRSTTLPADTAEQKLRQYYLDMSFLEQTSADDVRAMLDRFWHRLLAGDEVQQAFALLELEVGADWNRIKRRYQELASRHHPDRGGDGERFGDVREAYELLRRLHR